MNAAATAAVVLLVGFILAGCEPLSAGELNREVDSIASVAAEGAVLAEQVSEQQSKRTFARVQARELGDQAEHSAERLTDAHPAPGLEERTTMARGLAADVADLLGEIEVAPDDARAASAVAERLRALAAEAREISG